METGIYAAFSSDALQSGAAKALEVRVFQVTAGRLRLGLFSEGQLLALLEGKSLSAATQARATALAIDLGAERYALATPAEAEAEALSQFLTRAGVSPGTAAMEAVEAAGRGGEFAARGLLEAQGEIVVLTQYSQGAAARGFDFLSAARTPSGGDVFINEVRNRAGLQAPGGLSALGLGRRATFLQNLGVAEAQVGEQVADVELRQAIIRALQQRAFTVRLIGRQGIRITPRTASRIQRATGTSQAVIILDTLRDSQ